MIKKLIFDLDNTLIIWKDEYSLELKYLLEEYKIDICYKKVDKIIDDLEYKHDTISEEILLNDINSSLNLNLDISFIKKLEKRQSKLSFIDDDLIDVLYVAHHGKRFSDYFEGWLKMRDTDEQFTMFQVISLLTTMGVPNISINYLPDVAESLGCVKFDYPKFIQAFGEFCSNIIRRRCFFQF